MCRFVCLYIDSGIWFWLFLPLALHLFQSPIASVQCTHEHKPHHDGNSSGAHTIISLQLWVEAGAAQTMCVCQLSTHFALSYASLYIFFSHSVPQSYFPAVRERKCSIAICSEREIGLVCWAGQAELSLSHEHGRVAAPGPSFLNWWGWTHAEVKLAFVQRLGSGCGRLKVMDGCRA